MPIERRGFTASDLMGGPGAVVTPAEWLKAFDLTDALARYEAKGYVARIAVQDGEPVYVLTAFGEACLKGLTP